RERPGLSLAGEFGRNEIRCRGRARQRRPRLALHMGPALRLRRADAERGGEEEGRQASEGQGQGVGQQYQVPYSGESRRFYGCAGGRQTLTARDADKLNAASPL